METIVKADIFFVVTTVAVVGVAVAFIVAIIYLISILRQLRGLMIRIREEGEAIADDIKAVRKGFEVSSERTQEVVSWVGKTLLRVILGCRSRGE